MTAAPLEAKMLKYAEDLVGSLRADLEVEKRLRNEAQVPHSPPALATL